MYQTDKLTAIEPDVISDPKKIPSSQKPFPEKIKVAGLCLGASTVSIVKIESEQHRQSNPENKQTKIVDFTLHTHEGNPKQTLLSIFEKQNIESYDRIVATGRRYRNFVQLTSISEPEAVEYAYHFVKPSEISSPAIVSAGGETTMVYVLNRMGRITNVLTGNKCASGTGEFFLQQLRRMNVSLETAAQWAATETPYHVSGRCSVFCKSDCTHATNKGIPKAKVTAGLCKMMANKILELLRKIEKRNIMLIGGVAQNQMMIQYLRKEIPDLIVPPEAPYFEALGAALWGLQHETIPLPSKSKLIASEASAFDTLPPLKNFEHMVEFKTLETGKVQLHDECLLGLDVGSTTTKAVLFRNRDDAILASVYLRTNGDPVEASRQCYQSILNQIKNKVDPAQVFITGLGVCGSGRQIAGLHALTDAIINEIVAHANAAVYFDPGVDTIFEIGGQDAKYTYVTNRVPSDYAMNEACSAGTGSFLEESAYETLGVKMEEIAGIAVKGERPPNFNDQCAAFIASDIKNAIHQGIEPEDIIAGLVYSICMNYSNRVKGNRPVGGKVFMQGGVCYNKAIPLAMAALVGKPIIVPPEPGLMGAYGVALEVKKRLELGLLQKQTFNLQILADRKVTYRDPFACKGGKERCDRRCEIAIIEIEGKRYPFGGACNRYYNLRHNIQGDTSGLDLVSVRQQLVFEKHGAVRTNNKPRGRIGINKSFLVNTYYPLYSTFFSELGFEVVISGPPSQEGIDQKNAPFCYPAELSHGFFHSLLHSSETLDLIFLPHFKAVPDQIGSLSSQVCPLVQGEPYYLRATFQNKLCELKQKGTKILTPLIDLTKGLESSQKALLEAAVQAGVSIKEGKEAFKKALQQQRACLTEMKALGEKALKELQANPEKIAVVLFARPYNGFVGEAHKGIPHKLASRGIMVMPLDFLPLEDLDSKRHMYWGMGQLLLKAANFVKRHPQLFGTYITNFSCGPDSFIIGYFRDIMGRKPSLTLELDSHTADAGLETRIEAFLDIVSAYRQLMSAKKTTPKNRTFVPCRTFLEKGIPQVVTSSGQKLPMNDEQVTLLFPSMGKLSTEAVTAVFRGKGFNAFGHPPADEAVLKLGRANTSCKECLPLILTTGTLLNYIYNRKRADEVLVYFMPTGSGPCRFGQYYIFMEDLVKKLKLPDVAILSLTGDNSYVGLGVDFQKKGWWAILLADIMEDIRSMILSNSVDTESALRIFVAEWHSILSTLESGDFDRLEKQLSKSTKVLSDIPLKQPVENVPKILLTGEIFVRRDELSRQFITEFLAQNGFATICSPIAEWVFYCDYSCDKGFDYKKMNWIEKTEYMLKKQSMNKYEKRIKAIMSRAGLAVTEPLYIEPIIKSAIPYISPDLNGEAILTVGSSLTEVASHVCGVIAIGPFGCMPNRISEAILNEVMNSKVKLATDPDNKRLQMTLTNIEDLPFLSIESDGSPFPQLIYAKLEAFFLRARRLHSRMIDVNRKRAIKAIT